MALKKDDAARAITDEEKQCIKLAEEYIDWKLAHEYVPDTRVIVSFDELKKNYDVERITHIRVIRALLALYKNAGWEVKVEHDQRDGSWLEFS